MCSFIDADVNPNTIVMLLPNGSSTLFIIGNKVFSIDPRSLPRNPPECTILNNFVLAD